MSESPPQITIRLAHPGDDEAIWAALEPVFRAGETYGLDPDIPREAALAWWAGPGREVFVAELDGKVAGTFYLGRNQGGGGAHVATAGFVTAQWAEGRGVARAMIAHALAHARASGYTAMQFNFVVSTNVRAVALWQQHGFGIVGCLPGAFRHPDKGLADAYVMFRSL
ncbi:MAG: GNAT family N-acetyltransferase [Rhodobacteraceae bacterium]|nr:GNAT family N-acetyltransferase [Paracoccaceae bacterium]